MASIRSPFGEATVLATENDLNGTVDNTQVLDLTGAAGAVIAQIANGTAGTEGIDVIEVSKDGGYTWEVATVRDDAGDETAEPGELNAAGIEPAGAALFTMHPRDGQMNGPTLIRCNRSATASDWVTGAPSVVAIRIG